MDYITVLIVFWWMGLVLKMITISSTRNGLMVNSMILQNIRCKMALFLEWLVMDMISLLGLLICHLWMLEIGLYLEPWAVILMGPNHLSMVWILLIKFTLYLIQFKNLITLISTNNSNNLILASHKFDNHLYFINFIIILLLSLLLS